MRRYLDSGRLAPRVRGRKVGVDASGVLSSVRYGVRGHSPDAGLARNPVHSALALMACFLQISAIFVMLGAPLLAVIQIFVYVGATWSCSCS